MSGLRWVFSSAGLAGVSRVIAVSWWLQLEALECLNLSEGPKWFLPSGVWCFSASLHGVSLQSSSSSRALWVSYLPVGHPYFSHGNWFPRTQKQAARSFLVLRPRAGSVTSAHYTGLRSHKVIWIQCGGSWLQKGMITRSHGSLGTV